MARTLPSVQYVTVFCARTGKPLKVIEFKPYQKNRKTTTNLHIAALKGDHMHGVVVKLLAKGADPYSEDISGVTPWMEAVLNNNFVLAKALFNGRDVNKTLIHTEQDDTVFHIACRDADEDFVRLLLCQGGEPRLNNYYLVTPFMYALSHNSSSVIQVLSKHGKCDYDTCDMYGQNIVMHALMNNKPNVLEEVLPELVKKGADINYQDAVVRTSPLMFLISEPDVKNKVGKIRSLLKLGANPYLQDMYGHTAFVYAVKHAVAQDDCATLECLIIEANLDVRQASMTCISHSPLFGKCDGLVYAVIHDNPDVAHLLLDYNCSLSSCRELLKNDQFVHRLKRHDRLWIRIQSKMTNPPSLQDSALRKVARSLPIARIDRMDLWQLGLPKLLEKKLKWPRDFCT